MRNDVATRCRQAREQAGLSIWQVARMLSPEAARVEAGGEYDELRLRALADTYGVSLAWLRDGTPTAVAPEATAALRDADISTSDRAAISDLSKTLPTSSRKRTPKEITAEIYGQPPFSGRGYKHGRNQSGEAGPCEPDCRKCELEAELAEASRDFQRP